MMRRKYQLTRSRVQLQNRLECLLEEAHLKLSSLVSDLLGLSARRMLQAVADGETNPAILAAPADRRLRATPDQLRDALGAATDLHPVYRRLLHMTLEELHLLEAQMSHLDRSPNSCNASWGNSQSPNTTRAVRGLAQQISTDPGSGGSRGSST